MKSLIMGTAGHIDHGKTALIRSLTNIECDTHPEEKLRGITINLGFAHLELPNGSNIGIVDVPGHSDFINTMVAGASGIDFVMLVIAADSGVMPQTIEHLQIMEMLGIHSGFIAITKTDLVDEELHDIIENEISEFLQGTFLENAEMIRVSTKNGEGISELINCISNISDQTKERPTSDTFRLYIDRIFTVQGFGTVVTGSVLGGLVKKAEHVYLLPANKELRIRRMERHGIEVDEIEAGNRVSINLVGLSREDFKRGMLISDKILESTKLIDAKITLFQSVKEFSLWSQVLFILGTYKNQARIHLIERNKLRGGNEAVVQIHLSEPLVGMRGDKFVIRSSDRQLTLGGGELIDAHPLHHRRRPEKLVSVLKKVAEGGIPEFIESELHKHRSALSSEYLSEMLGISHTEIDHVISTSLPEGIVTLKHNSETYFLLRDSKEKLSSRILKNLESFHKRNPLNESGKTFEELLGIFSKGYISLNEAVLYSILDELITVQHLKKVGKTFALFSHSVKLTPEEIEQIKFVEDFHKDSGMRVPLMSELVPAASQRGIAENKLMQILHLLASQGKLYNIDGNNIYSPIVDDCRKKVLLYLSNHEEGITVAGFRDLINGNRKICLLLFSQFDREGMTIRDGDYRIITDKGKQSIKNSFSK